MVAKYFFPEVTFDEIAKISAWQPGYVVWSFKFWLWIMSKGVRIKEYDTLDYELWIRKGVEGLRKSVSEKEFKFYKQNTKDIKTYSKDIARVLKNPKFSFSRRKPMFSDLEENVKDGKICEVVLDSRTLKGKKGFSLHRVVVLDKNDDSVIFHDPADKPNVKVGKKLFIKSWLEAVSEPELCIYEKI